MRESSSRDANRFIHRCVGWNLSITIYVSNVKTQVVKVFSLALDALVDLGQCFAVRDVVVQILPCFGHVGVSRPRGF